MQNKEPPASNFHPSTAPLTNKKRNNRYKKDKFRQSLPEKVSTSQNRFSTRKCDQILIKRKAFNSLSGTEERASESTGAVTSMQQSVGGPEVFSSLK